MGPQSQTVARSSQATPLAGDVLSQLRNLISTEGLGAPVTALQQEAGTSARQFVQALQGGTAVRDVPSREGVRGVIRRDINRATEEQAANLRESFGASGSGRFGSSLLGAERELRTDALTQLADALTQMEFQAGQLGIQRDLGVGRQLLQGIQSMQSFGAQNLQPFLQLAATGILPEEIITTPNPFLQLGTALIGGAGSAAQGALSAGGALA